MNHLNTHSPAFITTKNTKENSFNIYENKEQIKTNIFLIRFNDGHSI